MAKSLRSKSKLGSRNVKRYNEKSDYAVIHAARLHATASRLAEKNKTGKTVAEEEADQAEAAMGDERMGDAGSDEKATLPVADTENGSYPTCDSDAEGIQSQSAGWAMLLGLCDPEHISLATIGCSADEKEQSLHGWPDAHELSWLLEPDVCGVSLRKRLPPAYTLTTLADKPLRTFRCFRPPSGTFPRYVQPTPRVPRRSPPLVRGNRGERLGARQRDGNRSRDPRTVDDQRDADEPLHLVD